MIRDDGSIGLFRRYHTVSRSYLESMQNSHKDPWDIDIAGYMVALLNHVDFLRIGQDQNTWVETHDYQTRESNRSNWSCKELCFIWP